ncbi:MAG: DcaP family trimeric outer membrane transporter [Bacteroidota bacterium]
MKKFLFTFILLASFVALIAQDKDNDKKKLTFEYSGYVNLNAIFDFNGLNDYNDFTTSEIPINPSPYEKTYRFHMTAQQSRMNFGVNYVTPWGNLKGFVSGDFASGTNAVFRLRQAYLEMGPLLLGQANTTFGNPNVVPVTIDFEGPNSATTLRNPMIRYSNKITKGFSYIIAVEMRGTDRKPLIVSGKVVEKEFDAMPAFVGTINKEGDWGVVSLSGTVSNARFFNLDSIEKNTIGYGGAFSAIIKTWGKNNHFNVFFIAGKGISNFINDLSGNGYNGVPDIASNKLILLNSMGGFVSYTHNWNSKLSSNFIFSYIHLEKTSLLTAEDFNYSNYALVNLFYSPFKRLNFGVEYIWGELFVQDDQNGDANRLQFLAQFTF